MAITKKLPRLRSSFLCLASLIVVFSQFIHNIECINMLDRRKGLEEETGCSQAISLTPKQALAGHRRRSKSIILLSGPPLKDVHPPMGLINQHSALLSLLTLALAARVDRVILPQYMHRSEFSAAATWQDGGPEDLWDTEGISSFLQARGIGVQVYAGTLRQQKQTSHVIEHVLSNMF